MSPAIFGLISGSVFGLAAVTMMLPLTFVDKPAALSSAFFSRFAIGFLIPNVSLPLPMMLTGLLVGLMISLPDAIITKTYGPILGVGMIGGALIGWLAPRILS